MREHIAEETKLGGGNSVFSEVMAAQEIVSFGYGSQSRETMEVGYSAKSECYGAFERWRETSTMEEFNKRMDQKMDQILQRMDEMESRIIQAIRKEMRI